MEGVFYEYGFILISILATGVMFFFFIVLPVRMHNFELELMSSLTGVPKEELVNAEETVHAMTNTGTPTNNTPKPTIYSSTLPNANVNKAGTVIATNNGSRSPVTKTNDGDAFVFCATNCAGTGYGGNWFGTFAIALTPEAAHLTAPTTGVNVSAHNINGVTYYIGLQITNRSWGGATSIASPIDVPILNDVFIVSPNTSPSTEVVKDLINRFNIKVNI